MLPMRLNIRESVLLQCLRGFGGSFHFVTLLVSAKADTGITWLCEPEIEDPPFWAGAMRQNQLAPANREDYDDL
jgi:hypothetical protein